MMSVFLPMLASSWFPGETLPFLFVAMAAAFILGLAFGWIIWGRLQRYIKDHEENAERLERSIASLEADLQRAEKDKQALIEARDEALSRTGE